MAVHQPLSSHNSRSAPDLTTVGWRPFSRTGFPPGTTVDELRFYRRKRPSEYSWPHDNLCLREGSFKCMKTEYVRRFKNYYDFAESGLTHKDLSPVRALKPEDTMKMDGALELHPESEYNESFSAYLVERPSQVKSLGGSVEIIDSAETEMKETPSRAERYPTENSANYVRYPPSERPPLLKKTTNLKLEGDCEYTTENAEKFIEYLLTRRPELTRKPTTLRLEGEMETKTETADKFTPYAYQARPPLCKKFTNLHLEGDLDNLTEKQEKFVAFPVQRRPKLTKKPTNLHVEGEIDLLPEYRREFVEYKTERTWPVFPVDNLRADGIYDDQVAKPHDLQMHPIIPFLRSENDGGHAEDFPLVRVSARPREESGHFATGVAKSEGGSQSVAKADNLRPEGRIDMDPEYRNAYVDRGRAGLGVSRGRRAENLKIGEGAMDGRGEYARSYVDFPRERPKVVRPRGNLSSDGEMEHTTEKGEQYVAFPNVHRAGPLKRDTELKLEGEFECQPEYRKAYIDYLTRERIERKSRPLDNLGREQKRVVELEPVLKTSLVDVPKVMEPPILSQMEETSPTATEPLPIISPTESKMETLKPVAPRTRPPSSTTSSVPSSPKIGKPRRKSSLKSPKKIARDRSLSHIEANIFGPKLSPARKNPTVVCSRSSSPVVPEYRSIGRKKSRNLPECQQVSTTSDSDFITERPPVKRFSHPVRVENLALRPPTPLKPLYDDRTSAKSRWLMRDHDNNNSSMSVESNNNSSAFVILDKEVHFANNLFGSSNDEGNFGEMDKWTPSWYDNNQNYR